MNRQTARRWLLEREPVGPASNTQRRGADLVLWRRQVIRTVACPICPAEAATPCQGRRGAREQPHYERANAARRSPSWGVLAPICSPDCPSCDGTGWIEIDADLVDPCPRRRTG